MRKIKPGDTVLIYDDSRGIPKDADYKWLIGEVLENSCLPGQVSVLIGYEDEDFEGEWHHDATYFKEELVQRIGGPFWTT